MTLVPRTLLRWLALSSVALLTACGGGESSTSDTTPPTIVGTAPVDGATGVARDASVTLTFDEPVAAASVTSTTIVWLQGATPVPYTASVAGAVVTLTADALPLANEAPYTVQVTTGVTDAAGNPLAAGATIGFTTRDDVAPSLASALPADGATGVARDASVTLTFDEPVAAASVTSTTIVWLQGATPVPYTASVAGAVVTLTPTGTLANAAPHTVQVTTGVTDDSGNALAAPATFAFTTLDDVAPSLASALPADGATGVARDASVTLTFDEPVAAASVTSTTIVWLQGATPVPYTASVAGAVVTLTADALPLANEAPYTVQVTTGVTDAAGNALAAGATIGFTTRDDVAPAIAGHAPADGATGVARNVSYVVTFDEPMAPGSVTPMTVVWLQGATPVPYTASVAGAVVTLTPTGTLANAAPHTVQVTTGVTDDSGNALAVGATWSFTTLDNVGPAITATSPLDGATGVSRSSSVVLTFDEPVAPASVTPASVVWLQGATPVPYTASVAGAVVTLTPTGPLANAAPHTVQVTAGVTDASGNALAPPVTFGFTTRDDVAPRIVSTVPVANATGVPRDSTFVITFDEPVDSASVDGVTVGWQEGTASPVPFDVAVAGAVVTLTPTATLADAAQQTVTVTTGVKDLAGNALASPATFRFLTVDDVAPAIVGTAPSEGAMGVARTGSVVLTFGEPVAAGSITPTTLRWTQGGVPVPFVAGVGGPTVTLTPVGALGVFAPQAVEVTTGVTDLAGNGLAAPVTLTFTTLDDAAPAFPAPPTDGDWSLPAAVTFDWVDATDVGSGLAPGYAVRVNTVPFDTGGLPTFPAPAPPFGFDASDAGSYPEGTILYAQVLATDAAGNATWSDWSDGVTIDRSPPTPPLAPVDPGAALAELQVTFVWSPTDDAVSGVGDYTIQVATANDGVSGLLPPVLVPAGTSYLFTGVAGPTYFARVLATDRLGQSSAYGPFSDGITLGAAVPGTPGAPGDAGDFTADSNLTFSWGSVPGAAGYVVELGTTPGGNEITGATPVAAATTTVTHDVGASLQGQTIYARVAAVDAVPAQGGWSEPSDGITLDLSSSPPSVPGTPQDRGAADDPSVTVTWAPSSDPESGVASYDVEFFADGLSFFTTTVPGATLAATADASGREGSVVTARVRARNGAGTAGGWSAPSDGVTIESGPPTVTTTTPGEGWTGVGTNVDLVLAFSEPMDTASVEAALSVAWGAGAPVHGLAFAWDPTATQVTVMPDSADPVGITNVDLLPEETAVTVTLADTATDAAGNPLAAPYVFTFTTADETPPALVSLTVGGSPSPFPAASVQGGFTLVATFDEDMSPTRGSIRVDTRRGGVEGRYSDWSASAQGAAASGGQVTWTLWGCPGIQVGDVITVRSANPSGFDAERATVLATGDDGTGNCTFTIADTDALDPYLGNAQVYYPQPGDARIAWTGPRTLALTLPDWVALPPASEIRVTVNGSDAAENWTWTEQTLQIRPLPGVDAVAPALASAVPLDGAAGVPRNAPAILRFTEPIDATTLDGAYAVDGAGSPWEMHYSSDGIGPVVLFVPLAAPAGGRVDVHVPATVRDLSGNLLGAPIDLSFDVAPRTDFDVPVLYDTQPPDGVPVDGIWQAGAVFADDGTGMLELLDARTAGDEDVLVVDGATLLPVRGYRVRLEPGSGVLEIQPPPRGPGFGTDRTSQGLQGATAAGGVATYTTWGSHGLQPGRRVRVEGMTDGCFNSPETAVLDVPSGDTFTLPTGCGDGATAFGGWAEWSLPRTFVVSLAVPPAVGGTGILDFEGNSMAPVSFTATVEPAGANRVPLVESLHDLRVGAATGPMGRQLTAEFRVRDPDDDPVTVAITGNGVPLTLSASSPMPLGNTAWGADFRLDTGGPPTTPNPPELTDANFPVSGYYPFAIALSDGVDTTTYLRMVWVWAPADVPGVLSIDDDGAILPVDATRPVVVERTAAPVFQWGNVDPTADFQTLQLLELSAAVVGGDGGDPQGLPLATSVTSSPFPVPLEPTLYAWFVGQSRFAPGEISPLSEGWSLDFGSFFESTFVFGPANRTLGGGEYGAARASFVTDESRNFASAGDATGLYVLEARLPTESAPVFVDEAMTTNAGAPANGVELFAADPQGGFMLTTLAMVPSTPPVAIPLANRGFVSRAGSFFAVADQSQVAIGLEAGVRRDPALDFTAGIEGKTFAFVQAETQTDGVGGFAGIGATVGEVVAGATELGVTLTHHDGSSEGPFPVPYTVGLDGFLRVDTRGDGSGYVSGWLGGAPGGLMGALAADSNPQLSFFLVLAERYDWQPTDGASLLVGDYRLVEYTVGEDGAGGLGELHASAGVASFDGAGGFAYQVRSEGQTLIGTGSYSVDPVAERVTLVANAGTPGEQTFLLAVAPDPDTVFGVAVDDPLTTRVLILSR